MRTPNELTLRNLAVTGEMILGGWGTVTQDTSITTGVTVNTKRGAITTVDPALGAGAEAEFTVTNSACHSGSVIVLSVASGPSDNEHVFAFVSSVAEGSFSIVLSNLAAAAQADGAMVINFAII